MTEITDALIYISNRCNLNCAYCFTPKKHQQKLNWAQIKTFLDWFLELPTKVKRIGIAGGEPLLELNLLSKMLTYIHNSPFSKDKSIIINDIVTNGTILNSRVLSFLKRGGVGLNFSLDGDINSNLNRRYKNGGSCFGDIWRNLTTYKKKIGDPLISMTVTPNNVKNFFSNIKFFLDNSFYKIKLSPSVVSEIWNDEKVDDFLHQFKQICTYCIHLKRKGLPIDFLENMAKKIRTQGFFDCSIGRQYVLSFDGNIYLCPLAHSLNRSYRSLVRLGYLPRNISFERFPELKTLNCLKQYGFSNNDKIPYLNNILKMSCLLFGKNGRRLKEKNIRAELKLFLGIYKTINKVFGINL